MNQIRKKCKQTLNTDVWSWMQLNEAWIYIKSNIGCFTESTDENKQKVIKAIFPSASGNMFSFSNSSLSPLNIAYKPHNPSKHSAGAKCLSLFPAAVLSPKLSYQSQSSLRCHSSTDHNVMCAVCVSSSAPWVRREERALFVRRHNMQREAKRREIFSGAFQKENKEGGENCAELEELLIPQAIIIIIIIPELSGHSLSELKSNPSL